MFKYLRQYVLLSVILAFPLTGVSQNYNLDEFTALQSSGEIPHDFLQSAQKTTEDYSTQKKKARGTLHAKGHEKFQIVSNYGINEMFMSGRVVFGDPVGIYVNRVADTLLRSFPEIRSQMRFYVTKSTVANAYSTDQGVVFINIGLIARLKNEAELAYIIAHEVVHFVKKHNITIFLEKEKVISHKTRDNSYKNLSIAEKLLAINYRSKEIETDADLDGLRRYYSQTHYDISAAKDVLDVLLYSSFPFTNEPFDLSLLETKDMIIPDYYLIDEVDELRVNDDEADSMSTHPSVKVRKQRISSLLDSIAGGGTQQFLLPKQDFDLIRNLARFEVVRQLIINQDLPEALYCVSELLHELPDNFYLKKCYAAALYGISAYKTQGETSDNFDSYHDVKGEMRQVNYMISKMSRRDVNIIALNYVWRLHNGHPDDEYLTKITKDLLHDLVFECETKKSFFYAKPLAQLRADLLLQPEKEDTAADNSRMRKKKHTRQSKIDTTFSKFAFVDLLQNKDFNSEFDVFENRKDSIEKAEEDRSYQYSMFPQGTHSKRKPKKERHYIHSFLMADPYTIKIDNRKRDNVKYRESELNQARIKELMTENARKAGVDMKLVDAKDLNENSTRDFNEMAFVKEYIEERFNQPEEGIVSSFCEQYIDSLMKRNNTHYLGWTAIISIQKKKPVLVLSLLSILPYLWPYTIYELAVPKIHTYYYHILFDVDTGKLKIAKVSRVRTDFRKDQLNSHIYDFIYSIKKTYE